MPDGDDLVLGTVNSFANQTHLARQGSNTTSAFTVANSDGSAIVGSGWGANGNGVEGASDSEAGVRGSSNSGAGVQGRGISGPAVEGLSRDNDGIIGITQTTRFDNPRAGVRGLAYGEGLGVMGESEAGAGVMGLSGLTGVWGAGAIGVRGSSSDATGVYGQSNGQGFNSAGVRGVSVDGNGVIGSSATGWAGFFVGPVFIDGNLVATGAKSAALAHPDGTVRLTYAIESPESWLEDFGRAELVDGSATVPLDPDFAALIDTGGFHVFVTPEGDCAGLYVIGRTPEAFEVRESQRGRSNVSFSYRVVARRRDLEGQRFALLDQPSVPEHGAHDWDDPPQRPLPRPASRQRRMDS
jgi:hypothetical protein